MPDAKPLPLPDAGTGALDWWFGQLDWSADIRKNKLTGWRTNARAYQDTLSAPEPGGMRVNIEFEKTETKRHQLLFRLPAIKLRPTARTSRDSYPLGDDGLPDLGQAPTRDLKKAVAIFREVLSRIIGPKGANTKALMDELIFDVLCPSGIAFCKLGYERYTSGSIPVQVGTEERPVPGRMLGLRTMTVPIYDEAPNVVSEQYYASRISPARALLPAEFMRRDYNLAEWLGYDFFITSEEADRRRWNVDGATIIGHDRSAVSQDDRIVPLEESGRRSGQIHCREVFFHPYFLGQHDNPDKIRRLVFVGNKSGPVVHEDFKDQRFDARGKWIGGLKTNPIKVYSTRYVSDCSYPPSDCTITRQQSDEVAEYRTQQIKHLKHAVPRLAINIDACANDKIKQLIIDDKHYGNIPVNVANLDKVAREIAKPSLPPENSKALADIMADIDRAWALGGNATGVTESGSPTATEIAAIAQATANRLGGERETTIAFWLSIVEGLGALVQLYADREDYVEIVGETGAKQIEAWDKSTIAGDFLFEAVPDSSLPPDASADRDLALNFHNLVANNPYFNGEQDARDLAEAFGRDPDRAVKTPDPTPPEKPKINLAINGKDLDPSAPQYQNVINVLIAAGIPAAQIAPPTEEPSPENPIGPADVVDRERLRMAISDERDKRSPSATALTDTPVSA